MTPAARRRVWPIIAILACVLVVLIVLAWHLSDRPQFTLGDFPEVSCTAERPGSGHSFYVDPQRGSPDGDGSRERPWHDLQFLVSAGLLGESEREVRWHNRLASRLTGQPASMHVASRPEAVIGSGDTIILADGDYGVVDLSGLANAGYLTIAADEGANPRFSGLYAAGASHFIFRKITVSAPTVSHPSGRLMSTYSTQSGRADNILFDAIAVASPIAVAAIDRRQTTASLPDGIQIGGDCITVRRSTLRNLQSAISVVRARMVNIADNAIHDFTVDGIQFSGTDIAILRNVIYDHWRTANKLHPDCMQGQPQGDQVFGPVTISHNVCIARLAPAGGRPAGAEPADGFGWQGISIFDGRWRGVTIACNLVMPTMQHGIALYGATNSRVEHNVVAGTPEGRLSWIAMMPSKEGRAASGVAVRGNRATGYINAIYGGAIAPDAMIDFIKAKRADKALMQVLMQPIAGVAMADNTWLVPLDQRGAIPADTRFDWQSIPPVTPPASIEDAQRRYPLPAQCAAVS